MNGEGTILRRLASVLYRMASACEWLSGDERHGPLSADDTDVPDEHVRSIVTVYGTDWPRA